MARRIRYLLAVNNRKLGRGGIAHFDLPAGSLACPGRTPACEQACYAQRGRFHFPQVVDRLAWCFTQSLRSNFVTRLVSEIRCRGIRFFRWHVSGDIYDPTYAVKMLLVMRRCPRVRFWLYTRSWRVVEIELMLREMALLANCKVWYSLDRLTGFPAERPPNVRYAFMQDSDQTVEGVDLVFRTPEMRHRPRVGLPMVCPSDTPRGRRAGANCGSCGYCFDD